MSGELDDMSHLFPNERLGRIAALITACGERAIVIDRANFADLNRLGKDYLENLGTLDFYEQNERYMAGVEQECNAILNHNPHTVFLNLWHGTGFKFSYDLSRILKKRQPGIPVYGVGQKIDWFKQHIMELPDHGFNGLITGLGYDAIRKLVTDQTLEGGFNSVYRNDADFVVNPRKAVDVDDFPVAVYDQSIYTNLDEKVPLFTLTLSNQACPNACVYCVRPENYGRKVISRRLGLVVDEMAHLHETFGARHFRIEDSTPPPKALTDFADAVVSSDLQDLVQFSAFSRIDTNGVEDFQLMRKAGFQALFFGVETLDDDSLRRIRKGTCYEMIKKTLQRAHDAGIKTVGSFIYPLPGETRASTDATLKRIEEIAPWLDSALILPAAVYPPTDWGRHPEEYGILVEENYVEKFIAYPLKYMQPLRLWPPVPFKYNLMGKPACDVTFDDIISTCETFVAEVRTKLSIPPIADYYYLLADMMGRTDTAAATQDLVKLMIQRDYNGIRQQLQMPARKD